MHMTIGWWEEGSEARPGAKRALFKYFKIMSPTCCSFPEGCVDGSRAEVQKLQNSGLGLKDFCYCQ